jgi:hypothetical protein
MSKLTIIPGPPVTQLAKEAAVDLLKSHPRFPKNASFTVEEIDGRWVAAYAEDDLTKQSAPPFGGGEGGPPAPDAGPPAPEEGPPSEEAPPSDDEGGEEGPPKEEGEGEKGEGKEHGEKGVEAQLHAVTEMLHTIVTALGLDVGAGDSMIPGEEGSQHAPGPSSPDSVSPAGPDTDPNASGSQGPDGKTHTVHERALKPGEAQPGSTPIGAPAFASVSDDHPWKEVIGKVRSFSTEEVIDEDATMATVAAELNRLAEGTGYRVEQLREARENGQRVAKALLVR